MTIIHARSPEVDELLKALGLGDTKVTSLTIRVRRDQPVKVFVGMYVSPEAMSVLQRYALTRLE